MASWTWTSNKPCLVGVRTAALATVMVPDQRERRRHADRRWTSSCRTAWPEVDTRRAGCSPHRHGAQRLGLRFALVTIEPSTNGRTWTRNGPLRYTGPNGSLRVDVKAQRTARYRMVVSIAPRAGRARPTVPVLRVAVLPKVRTRVVIARTGLSSETITGAVLDARGRGVARVPVVLQYRLGNEARWTSVTTVATDPAGRVRLRPPARARAHYRLVFAGTTSYAAATSAAV